MAPPDAAATSEPTTMTATNRTGIGSDDSFTGLRITTPTG
jgi:hypothetical protein